MQRRQLLKYIAVITGATFVGGELLLTGCKTADKPSSFFSEKMIALLDEIAETIIPRTDTPGAKDAKVGEFMKIFVTDCYTPEQQDAFYKGVNNFNAEAQKAIGSNFEEATEEKKISFLNQLEEEAQPFNKKVQEDEKPEKEAAKAAHRIFVEKPRHYYTMLKQLTLLGYFTSEPGATKALRHVPVPGKYDGAYPYKKGDRAFS